MKSGHEKMMIKSARTKFVAMAVTYCLGVFNDNYFKQAAMLIAVSAGLNKLQGIATVLFALPFILCSSYAGWFADRFPKKKVVIGVKALEFLAMLIGAVGIVSGNWVCILSMVFLMGLQSAFFSPALNGSIPELYPKTYVPQANAVLKLTTTLAILAGIVTAGISLDQNWLQLSDISFGKIIVAGVVVFTAGLGVFASFGMYNRPAAAPQKPFPWLGPIRSVQDVFSARSDRQLFLAIIADAYFYFVASITILTINTLGLQQLGFSQTSTSMLSMFLMIGVCIGSLVAARKIPMDKWFRTMCPSGAGMAIGLFLSSVTPILPSSTQLVWLSLSLITAGICSGLFLIPVASFLQIRPARSDKGRTLATANFCSFIGILLSGSIFSLLDSIMLPAGVMVCLGVFALFAAAIFNIATREKTNISAAILRRFVSFILGLRYSIEVKGIDSISMKKGKGIIFLPNHPALIDSVICMSVLYPKFQPRPLVDHDQGNKPFVRWIIKKVCPILIPDLHKNGRNSHNGIKQALQEVVSGLHRGENIILYPAGCLYRSAKEDLAGNSGVEYILENAPDAQVVLVRTTGLWGSSFSWSDGIEPSLLTYLKKYTSALLANGIFFGPRRKVTIEIVQGDTLVNLPDRLSINRYLETFYNQKMQPNTHVPYYWWQGEKPQILPEPEKKCFFGDVSRIPDATRRLVIEKIEELTGISGIKGNDRLANDLAVDSLSLMEIAVWLENEFGMPLDDMNSLTTVNDCILAAYGRVFEKNQVEIKPIPEQWFQSSSSKTLTFPKQETIHSAFLAQAKRFPREIILADQISGQKTYRHILTGIFALKPIIEKIKDQRIGIMLPATVSAGIVYLAALFSGKTPVMVNWTVGIGNMRHSLKEVGVNHIITAKALFNKLIGQGLDLTDLQTEWLFIDEIALNIPWQKKVLALIQAIARPSSLEHVPGTETAAILFTSGSESKPKAVPLTHTNIMANMHDFTRVLSVRSDDRLLGMLPPFHSLGLVGTVVLPLCLGLKTVYHANPTEAVTLSGIIDHYKVSMLIGTPTFLSGIINAASKKQLASLKLLFTGAEKCPDHIYKVFHSVCPEAILCEGYGITECSPLVSVNQVENPKPGTIGKVLPSIEYAIVHPEKDERVKKGEQGLLLVRGPNVFAGYYNGRKGSGFYEFEGKNWYQTGDFVKEDDEGVLTFCGRKKRFIKLGGEMISLPAIEAALQRYYPAVNDQGPTLAVEATPTEEHPEIVLFTTLSVDREEANRSIRKAGLSALHNIRRLESIDLIPVLGTGKTDYKQLKERLAI